MGRLVPRMVASSVGVNRLNVKSNYRKVGHLPSQKTTCIQFAEQIAVGTVSEIVFNPLKKHKSQR